VTTTPETVGKHGGSSSQRTAVHNDKHGGSSSQRTAVRHHQPRRLRRQERALHASYDRDCICVNQKFLQVQHGGSSPTKASDQATGDQKRRSTSPKTNIPSKLDDRYHSSKTEF